VVCDRRWLVEVYEGSGCRLRGRWGVAEFLVVSGYEVWV